MARVKLEPIIEHLRSDMRRALEDALRRNVEGDYNINSVYNDFRRAVDRRTSTWVRVPDHTVETD